MWGLMTAAGLSAGAGRGRALAAPVPSCPCFSLLGLSTLSALLLPAAAGARPGSISRGERLVRRLPRVSAPRDPSTVLADGTTLDGAPLLIHSSNAASSRF